LHSKPAENQHLYNTLTPPNSINFNPHQVPCEGTTEGIV
jgi:hypothetical protein